MSTSFRSWVGGAFRSLAARVSFFVFAAALTSALAVAGTSAFALRAFLRSKIEQRIPAEVAQLRERLELWYAQRTLDVQVFARSAVVVDGLARLGRGGAAAGAGAGRADEVERYLSYVLAGLRHYVSLFVLDAEGRVVAQAGREIAFEPEVLQRLAAVEDADVSGLVRDGAEGEVQVVSSVVRGPDGRSRYSLHAVIPRAALEERLVLPEGVSGRVSVFDGDGRGVATAPPRDRALPPLPREVQGAGPGAFRDYTGLDGLRVVGSVLPFPRFGWTLLLEEQYGATFAPIASILSRTLALDLGIVLGLSALAFAVVAMMVRPLHTLSDCARRLRDGERDVELPVVERADEVGILARSFGEMVTSLRRAHELVEQLAITDGLTKIHNHRFFQDQLARDIKRSERTGEPLALLLLDIDDFKALNDRHGHAVGDAVLERLAALLVHETRDQDLVARYGGEEFAILAPATDLAGACALAEKLRMAVDGAQFEGPPGPISITVSTGVSVYRGDREAFFHEADRALYAAKAAGKDCVVTSGGDA